MAPLIMTPATGERVLRFVGDRVRFTLRTADGSALPPGWRVLLRTNIGRGQLLRQEIIAAYPRRPGLANAAWHDVPLERAGHEWSRELTLTETGFFRAKAYAVDPEGRQYWPEGTDAGVSVHADQYRTANTIYCAFPRMFGESKHAQTTANPDLDARLAKLDAKGYSVIPSSGKLRDLIKELPFIIDTLGCRILHLLPVNPTPTTFARFGRFGSPYASQDLTAIDPALVEFDHRTTGLDQFRELTHATHALGGRVFIDIVINHTGWGARLQEIHPEWYVRDEQGNFVSPGAWGNIWEDLAELDHRSVALWAELAEIFLVWCRRGVDGFRCDAGYKVPLPAWRYITARVLEEFPDAVFLLEGLGGSWEATEALLTDGAMQWAYSELFQNHSGIEISSYLEYALRQSARLGLYIHYSETHDNSRLAARGRAWSLLRNRLCALTSVSGGFGFTCGVEWLAAEKINVHSSRALAWGSEPNIVPELARLNALLGSHPCFFDGAKLTRVTVPDSPVFALRRESADGLHRVLVIVNNDTERAQIARFDPTLFLSDGADATTFQLAMLHDLLGQKLPAMHRNRDGRIEGHIPPTAALCLALKEEFATPTATTALPGMQYRRARAQAAWAVCALAQLLPAEDIGPFDWRALADRVHCHPQEFLGALAHLDRARTRADLLAALTHAQEQPRFPQVVRWELPDRRRVTLVPAGHWLLVHDAAPFRATLAVPGALVEHVKSIEVGTGHIACFAPRPVESAFDATLQLARYAEADQHVEATLRYLECGDLSPMPAGQVPPEKSGDKSPHSKTVLLTNGRGGMARLCVDFGNITSKYDCLLGANLHADLPVDRHVFAKRARLWLVADGFVTPLNLENLIAFEAGPPARWTFLAGAGNGRTVEIEVTADMVPLQNTTVLRFHRPARSVPFGSDLPPEARVSLTVRVDIEDRNFHCETQRNDGSELHFASNVHLLRSSRDNETLEKAESEMRKAETNLKATVPNPQSSILNPQSPIAPSPVPSPATELEGFVFTPAPDRQLRVLADHGRYHPEPEWCVNIPHPVEATRGQTGSGDAYSPGWFELPLERGENATLVLTAELPGATDPEVPCAFALESPATTDDPFALALRRAVKAFVVRRGAGKTVIAGYPWFLDWGRDSLICARGLIAAGMTDDVRDLLVTFARFEENGTLPNTIHGDNASNRDTTDAPLWFGVACEDLVAADGKSQHSEFYRTDVGGRTIAGVLRSIAIHYMRGTPNGIHMDVASGLIWSPSHFTWMDTNYPAGTPRTGYPIEIQALWIRLLKQLHQLGAAPETKPWNELAAQAEASLHELFWIEERGWFADVLLARTDQSARAATRDNALRSNCLFPISLGLVTGERARRCVANVQRQLVIPGALRSLAPLPVTPPLAIYGNHGGLLNDPANPYWGRYEGDEDTRRKPAYHNGTAWAWTFPSFCEAMVRAWDSDPAAVNAARAYLRSMAGLMHVACAGHIPEVLDGDAPHTPRGCDAQAWSATEALRVWTMLNPGPSA